MCIRQDKVKGTEKVKCLCDFSNIDLGGIKRLRGYMAAFRTQNLLVSSIAFNLKESVRIRTSAC
jgi:hypothetical protein